MTYRVMHSPPCNSHSLTDDEKLAQDWIRTIRDELISLCQSGGLSFEEAWTVVSTIPEPDYSSKEPPYGGLLLFDAKPAFERLWLTLAQK